MINQKNSCFIANFSKTYFFHAIAQKLQERGRQIYWITTNRRLYDFLCEHYDKKVILLINWDHLGKDQPAVGDYQLHELLYGDRVLRYSKEEGLRWLCNIQRPLYDFFATHQIEVTFGELTWAHEILIHRMLRKEEALKGRFLNPHVVRIPNRRFAFFEDERQSVIYTGQWPRQRYQEVLEVKKPDYLRINDKRLKRANSLMGRLDRVKRLVTNENMDKKDPTLLNHIGLRLKTRSQEELYKETYRTIQREVLEDFDGEPYVFLGLHKQPEASVDVFGRYYEDQFQNIQNIWRILPLGWKLLVKEHTNAIGDRQPAFYRRLQQLPNVHFVQEQTDAYRLIRGAELVVTITGTIAYEAALMGIPALTFAPVFFNRLHGCRQLTLQMISELDDLRTLIEELRAEGDNRLEFTNYLLNNSFDGLFSDPISNQAILDPKNVEQVSEAFEHVLQQQTVALSS
ncbi:MAG: hypothetical protein AAGG75_00050 [Bacteroidota bacterium]